MKNLSLILLSMTLSVLSTQVSAAVVPDNACFIISGTKHDSNGALARLRTAELKKSKFSFAGYNCSIFNSYQEMRTHLSYLRLPQGTPIIVVQEAHGSAGGFALLNFGGIEARTVVKEIRELSETYKVAFFNHSCFSGDMMIEKLNWEQQNQHSKSIDNSCVWTHSLPGRVSLGIPEPTSYASRNYNLEESYTRGPVGLLSSAAWSKVGIHEYYNGIASIYGWKLENRDVSDSLYYRSSRFLEGLSEIILENKDQVKAKNIIDNALFVLDPTTNYDSLKSITKTSSVTLNKEKIRQAVFFPPATTDTCTLGVRKFLVSQWYMAFTLSDSTQVFDLLKKNLETQLKPEYYSDLAACSDLGKENKNITEWIQWLKPFSPVADVLQGHGASANGLSDMMSSTELGSGMNARRLSMDEIYTKNKILLSIIGRSILNEETKVTSIPGNFYPSSYGFPSLGEPGATGNVLPAFTLASIKAVSLENSLDQRRRSACRGIELKAKPSN